MPQTTHQDLEGGNDPYGHHGHPHSTPEQQMHGESNFGDSSGPFFSIYSKAAEDEDNKMVDRWQKDADGILIFTGLFSAAVAALLAVTVQDLRPNSQDTSAFYLGNIYEFLADPNVTRASIPSPVAKPPPFSPPRYAIWVNSLWFLSLVMSVSCALWATSLHQWARRYIRLTQPARCSPEKRARMRAFFANGMDKMHIPWAVEGLPTLLHISLFLFFAGLVIFLFNLDQEVFGSVVWLIGLFSTGYGLITVLPLIRQDSPYSTPLSTPAWYLHASIPYIYFKVLASITYNYQTWERRRDLRDRYHSWMLGGVEKKAEGNVSEQSSGIDGRILGWTISALGDDDSLEKFFEAIPGLFNSTLVRHLERDFPETLLFTFWDALDGFMGRTLSSNSVTESVKSRRVITCKDIISVIPCFGVHISHLDQGPVSIERLQAMARWFTHISRFVSHITRKRVAQELRRMQDRDGRWIALVSDVYGLSESDVQHNVALGGDNVLLATLIDVSRRAILSDEWGLVSALTQFDIRHTLPGLQNDFCTLWNELVQTARSQGPNTKPVDILRLIRHLYIALHQGTDAVPTAFSASTDSIDHILDHPLSYPLCDNACHRPDSTVHVAVPNSRAALRYTQPGDLPGTPPNHSSSGGSTVSHHVREAGIVTGPPLPSNPMVYGEIGDSSRAPAASSPALPIHTAPRPTDASPLGAIAAILQDTSPTASLFHPLKGTALQDHIFAPCSEPDISEI